MKFISISILLFFGILAGIHYKSYCKSFDAAMLQANEFDKMKQWANDHFEYND